MPAAPAPVAALPTPGVPPAALLTPAAPPAALLPWQAEDLWLASQALVQGLSIDILPLTGSTNADALARLRQGPDGDASPCLIVAERQSAGRGRLGRPWWSAPGASLTFSLALAYAPADWSGLSLAVGLALAKALDPPRQDQPLSLGLKWPNDLWLRASDSKLGGILIETTGLPAGCVPAPLWPGEAARPATGLRWTVIGIGLNIAATPPDLPHDLPDVPPMPSQPGSGHEPPRYATGYAGLQQIDPGLSAPAVLARVLPALLVALRRFEAAGWPACAADWPARDLLLGRPLSAGERRGRGAGVAADGSLRLDLAAPGEAPRIEFVQAGEVSVRPC
ncbi:MAG: hypothetical protein RL722_365 [Pseudomonadota bacterium]|jgi:BirA family biotin operon repressor/biotin-[acetyl-CoA-carboxylase] ligase